MTVCIAAVCGGHDGTAAKHAVVAADRMVTMGGFIEFEHAVPKMAYPTPHAVSMIAGDTLVGTRLAREVEAALSGTTPPTNTIADALAQHYEAVRRERVEHEVLIPRGLDWARFYGAHASLNPQITAMLDNHLANYNLGVELLLAGVDGGGAHIFTIQNPGGGPLQHDVIGYTATGSGALHALQSMIGFQHHSGAGLKETIFRVYASKKRAEVAPGVGHDTDLGVISNAGFQWLEAEQITELDAAHGQYESSGLEAMTAALDDLTLPDPQPAPEGGEPDGTADDPNGDDA